MLTIAGGILIAVIAIVAVRVVWDIIGELRAHPYE
jgi:hypothetical protein